MSAEERAKQFFRLGEQYAETAKLLLQTLIDNGNSNAGIGKTEEEARLEMERNAPKSDLYLFVPAIFNSLQSAELLVKGLLLLVGKEFERKHGVEELLAELKDAYKEDSEIYSALKSFYESQIAIIEDYKKSNGIANSFDLYMSLRYPEISLGGKGKKKTLLVNYCDLVCNGDIGIEQFKLLSAKLEMVKLATVKEYYSKCP